jgi:hypothetical protein
MVMGGVGVVVVVRQVRRELEGKVFGAAVDMWWGGPWGGKRRADVDTRAGAFTACSAR